jgi:hypothetical protein
MMSMRNIRLATGKFIGITTGSLLKNGAKIGHVAGRHPDDMNMDVHLGVDMRFGNACPQVKGLGVIGTLREISTGVRQIVESFLPEFEYPTHHPIPLS